MPAHALLNSTIRRHFSSLMNETRSLIAVCQLTSTNDLEANFEVAKWMMKRAKERKAKVQALTLTLLILSLVFKFCSFAYLFLPAILAR